MRMHHKNITLECGAIVRPNTYGEVIWAERIELGAVSQGAAQSLKNNLCQYHSRDEDTRNTNPGGPA